MSHFDLQKGTSDMRVSHSGRGFHFLIISTPPFISISLFISNRLVYENDKYEASKTPGKIRFFPEIYWQLRPFTSNFLGQFNVNHLYTQRVAYEWSVSSPAI